MSANKRVEDMTPAERVRYEYKREREFYSYYEPLRALASSDIPWTDLNSPESVANHHACSSPDKALTAFCQLAAIRLGMRRAMIFFFDSTYAYVIAESTRTLSLQNDDVYDEDDELWLGTTKIPRGFSVCEHTVNLPSNGGTNADGDDSDIIHIINNLSEDTRFCNRPYVTDGPKARFYAGVPITSPKGLNIGALCVLDDEPHDGLDRKSTGFLQELGSAVMSHLEMVRARLEQRRGASMVSALGAFMAGTSDIWHPRYTGKAANTCEPTAGHVRAHATSGTESKAHTSTSQMSMPAVTISKASTNITPTTIFQPVAWKDASSSSYNESLRPPRGDTNSSGTSVGSDGETDNSEHAVAAANLATVSASSLDGDSQLNARSHAVRDTIQGAAELIRNAVGSDGVLFLDASVSGFGGLVKNPMLNTDPDREFDTTTSGAEGTEGTGSDGESLGKGSDVSDTADEAICSILGASYAKSQGIPPILHSEVTQKSMQSLLRHYKRGKIWNFSEYGEESSDNVTSDAHSTSDHATQSMPTTAGSASDSSNTKTRKRPTKAALGKEIRKLFPGSRSLMLLGLWDPTRDKWYAGCIIWTCSSTRVFSTEGEMDYLTAFCDVIMARLGRLDVELANKAKSDFISSISHELRSPLHGILGTVEILQDQHNDSVTAEMIAQIESCGRTLLDVVDHLLDFSKINSFAKQTRIATDPDSKTRLKSGLTMKKRNSLGGMMSVDADVCLDKITEEVVETAVYSYCCSKDRGVLSARKVTFIIDIDKSPGISWRCRIAVGAWKRVCINLVNNALKYTTAGYIVVSLKMIPAAGRYKRPFAHFTVSDSGRGMSKEFQENQLFRAFTQEDDLAEGTGLGMSMVAKIVRGLGGKVDVQSGRGAGTVVAVTLPLEMKRGFNRVNSEHKQRLSSRFNFTDISMAFLGSTIINGQESISTGHNLHNMTLIKTCSMLHIALPAPSWNLPNPVDITITTEPNIPHLLQMLQAESAVTSAEATNSSGTMLTKPLIVVCNDHVSVQRMKKSQLAQLMHGHVEYVAQPCGPERLAKAIQTCLTVSVNGSSNSPASDNSLTPQAGDYIPRIESPNFLFPSPASRYHGSSWRGDATTSNPPSPQDNKPNDAAKPNTKALEIPLRPSNRRRLSPRLGYSLDQEYPFPRTPGMTGIVEESLDPPSTSRPLPPKNTNVRPRDVIDPKKASLLLVDDNAINLQLLVTYARKQGHHKLTATHGAEAVEAYRNAALSVLTLTVFEGEKKEDSANEIAASETTSVAVIMPTVILMDISMPIMDGFEATRRIRAFESDNNLKPATIIALTGLGSAEAQTEAFVSGVNLFLTKPVRLKELTKLLKEIQLLGETQGIHTTDDEGM